MTDIAAPPIVATKEELLQVSDVTGQILDYQLQLRKAHELGFDQGTCRDPWGLHRCRQAMPSVAQTMPAEWMVGMGGIAESTAEIMRSHPVEGDLGCHWEIVALWFGNTSTAIREFFAEPTDDFEVDPESFQPAPGVMRFDELAAGIHPEATGRMIDACAAVASYSKRAAYGVTDTEIEWLQALARNERLLDVGVRYGYSERDFYRAIHRLWDKLEVDSRSAALVVATELGWVHDD